MSTTSAPAPDNAPSGPALLRRLLSFNAAQAGAAYRPDVDGLRALAVLPVMLFHAGFAAFPGGYVGVDIFFVLSGYLITGILEREIVAGRFSFVTFYERRARRILPALFAMILATTLSAWIVMLPQDFAEYGRTLWAVLGFVANYFFSAALGDYFATSSEFMPLLHMWSLAVEEQFYLLFPVLLIWLARAGLGGASGTGARLAVVGAICLVSLVLAQVLLARAPTPAFYHTEGRIWELGAGAMLALGLDRWRAPRALREAGAALGLALILGPVFLYGRATPFPGLAALPPVAGAALLLWAGARRRGEEGLPAVNRLLTAPPLVFVGLISYSLYLAHWPIMALLRNFTGFPHLSTRDGAIAVALSLVSATLCWLVVERPFRSRARIGQRGIFVASGLAAAAVAVFAAVLVTGQGLPARFAPNVTLLAHGMEDRNPRAAECFNTWPEGGPCRFGAETAPDAPADLLFWGDSHADALMPGMARAAEMTGRSGLFLGHAGCVPLFDMVRTDEGPWAECDVLYDRLRDLLTARPDIRTVVLYARWSLAYGLARPERGGGRIALRDLVTGAEAPTDMPLSEMFRRSLARTVEMLRATGREVVLVAGTPEIGWPVPMTLLNHARFDRAVPPAPDLAEVRDRNAPIRAIFDDLARDPGVRVVTLDDVLCTPDCAVEAPMRGTGAAREGGYPLYVDDNHVSASAARELLAPALAARIWPGEQEAGLAPGPPSLPDLPATRPDRSFDAQP